MEKHIYDAKNGLHYTLGEDGLYYPDIAIDEQEYCPIGKYGRLRLKEHKTGIYYTQVCYWQANSTLTCLKLIR